jgi:DnaJ family protein A protein 5
LFNTLASEEFPYIDEEEAMQFPLFGNSKSDYEPTVAAFYDFWTSFSTKRSFSWLDEQNAQSAFDRYELKWMNKENKKCRDAGKKERNQEIRNLVQHVSRIFDFLMV